MTENTVFSGKILILSAILAMPACSSTPTGINTSGEIGQGIDAEPIVTVAENADGETASTNSGLGPIVYEEPPRAVCKKRRRTGTNRRVSMCEKFVGSQPVRTVTEDDSTIVWGAIPTSAPANN